MFRFDARAQDNDIWHQTYAARAKYCPPFVDGVERDGCGEPPATQGDQVWAVCGHFNGTALIFHDSESLRAIRWACGRGCGERGGGRGIGVEVLGSGGRRGGVAAGERVGAAAHWPIEAWTGDGIDGQGRRRGGCGRGRGIPVHSVSVGERDVACNARAHQGAARAG